MRIYLIFTSTTEHLIKNISKKKKDFEIVFSDLSKDKKRYFPDGEIYIGISKAAKLKGKRVVVLHSGAPKPNKGLVEFELILQILKDNKIKPEVFFTYFPYGMQDRVFKKGETNISENLINKLVSYYKVKKIYIINPHFEGRKWMEKYPIKSISAIPMLMEKVKKDYSLPFTFSPLGRASFGQNILFLATDEGGKRRFKIDGFNKIRKNSYRVELRLSRKLQKMIKGKIIAILDDVLKTGITLLEVYNECKKYRAKKIICLIPHGVLKEGISKVKRKYSRLYLTNSINQKEANVNITDLILKTIQNEK